jgi:hypothetical protein
MRKIVDSDGVEVTVGCTISFGYGIPPVPVVAPVVERKGVLIALTPGHNPSEARVSKLRKHVGDFWVMGTADVHR